MLLFWGGLIVLAIWLVGLLFPGARQTGPTSEPPSAQAILDARFAQGDITEEQYKQMSQLIRSSHT
jgi:uncharacterized membrane protein